MYLDTVVVSGLIIVALCCVMTAYVSYYVYKKVREDASKENDKTSNDTH
jgi:hypothetical protein